MRTAPCRRSPLGNYRVVSSKKKKTREEKKAEDAGSWEGERETERPRGLLAQEVVKMETRTELSEAPPALVGSKGSLAATAASSSPYTFDTVVSRFGTDNLRLKNT